MNYKLDLHTHSIVSHDGGITDKQYVKLLQKKVDFVGITDHNIISKNLTSQPGLSRQLIIGEEISTSEGDIVGLFLKDQIQSGLTLAETIKKIKIQNGLVYVPHPYEKFRRGLQQKELDLYKEDFDIVEVFNGRSRNRLYSELSMHFAKSNGIAIASSSDAHGFRGVGTAYVLVSEVPTRENLVKLLNNGTLVCKFSPVSAYFYPVINKIKNYFKKKHV